METDSELEIDEEQEEHISSEEQTEKVDETAMVEGNDTIHEMTTLQENDFEVTEDIPKLSVLAKRACEIEDKDDPDNDDVSPLDPNDAEHLPQHDAKKKKKFLETDRQTLDCNPIIDHHNVQHGVKSLLMQQQENIINSSKQEEDEKECEVDSNARETATSEVPPQQVGPEVNSPEPAVTANVEPLEHNPFDVYDLGEERRNKKSLPKLLMCGQYIDLSSSDNDMQLRECKRKRYIDPESDENIDSDCETDDNIQADSDPVSDGEEQTLAENEKESAEVC